MVSTLLKNNMSWCATYTCSSDSSKINPNKACFILPKRECTKKAWIAAINQKEGTLSKDFYDFLFMIILKGLVSIKAEPYRHIYFTYHVPKKENLYMG